MATSGSFNTTGYEGRYLTFSWSLLSSDTRKNQSTISWALVGSGKAQATWYRAGNFQVVIDGEQVYYSETRIELRDGTVVANGQYTLTHNDEGKRGFSASVSAAIYSSAVNCYGNSSWQLPDILRASVPTLSKNNFTIGENITIYTNRLNNNYVHDIFVQRADGLYYDSVVRGVTDSWVWNTPELLYEQCPDANTYSAYILLRTWDDDLLVGDNVIKFTANVPDYDVTISNISITPIDALNDEVYVQGKSKVKVEVSANTKNAAYLSSYQITIDEKNYQGGDITSDLLSSGEKAIAVKVVDSRGKTAIDNSNKITVQAYAIPEITSLTVNRVNEGETVNVVLA